MLFISGIQNIDKVDKSNIIWEVETMKRAFLLISCLLIAGLLFTDFVWAIEEPKESAANFYKGKRINFIVTFSPGGGFDALARVIAPYLEKNTGATVVVQNMPGANGVIALNHLYNIAKPDGLTICIIESCDLIVRELVGQEGMKHDMTKFIYLAKIFYEPFGVFLGKISPFRSVDDIRKAPLIKFGSPDRADIMAFPALTLGVAFDLKNLRQVTGYKGGSDVRLAVLKGELDAFGGIITSAVPMVNSGDLIPLVITGSKRYKELPEIPTIYEVAPHMSSESKTLVDAFVKMIQAGRGVILGPGVPEERVQFLRDAFAKTLNTPELVADVKKRLTADMNYLQGIEYRSYLIDCLSSVQTQKDKLKFIIYERY